MANVQGCQRMATLNTHNPYTFNMATLTTLKSVDMAIRAVRAATCVTWTILTARMGVRREGLEAS